MIIDNRSLSISYYVAKCLYVSGFYLFYGFQLLQQHFACLSAYALDAVELALQCALAAFVAVEGNGEAVNLVLYACHKAEDVAVWLHSYNQWRVAEEQFAGAVAVVLCQSGNRYGKMQLVFNNASHHLHLSFATVGDDEVGQGRAFVDEP